MPFTRTNDVTNTVISFAQDICDTYVYHASCNTANPPGPLPEYDLGPNHVEQLPATGLDQAFMQGWILIGLALVFAALVLLIVVNLSRRRVTSTLTPDGGVLTLQPTPDGTRVIQTFPDGTAFYVDTDPEDWDELADPHTD